MSDITVPFIVISPRKSCRIDQSRKNEMGGAYSAYGGEERYIQGFGGETSGKETTWETET